MVPRLGDTAGNHILVDIGLGRVIERIPVENIPVIAHTGISLRLERDYKFRLEVRHQSSIVRLSRKIAHAIWIISDIV